ncbi:hypothetical protein LZ30DRAFT_337099 [Colletotrichum cereale]|nr:hypothetical protein LZ30DRAFT_337099 [Colletotrichum cereale]
MPTFCPQLAYWFESISGTSHSRAHRGARRPLQKLRPVRHHAGHPSPTSRQQRASPAHGSTLSPPLALARRRLDSTPPCTTPTRNQASVDRCLISDPSTSCASTAAMAGTSTWAASRPPRRGRGGRSSWAGRPQVRQSPSSHVRVRRRHARGPANGVGDVLRSEG